MIKKSPRKYFLLLLAIEILFLISALTQYFTNQNGGEIIELSAENFSSRAGEIIDNSYYVDNTYLAEAPFASMDGSTVSEPAASGVSESPEQSVSGTPYSGTFTYGPYVKVGKGSYDITLYYETNTNNNSCYVHSNTLTSSQLKSSYRVPLAANQTSVTFSAVLTQGTKDLEVITEYCGEGTLGISGMTLTPTSDYDIRNIFTTLAGCLFAMLCYWFYVSDASYRKTFMCLGAITIAASYPLFTDYLISGHDLAFHMNRIEGIAQGLSQGIFPVKIHPFWANDYGYAVGVFYGDTFLYFPAFLRNMGFSLQEAYKIYVFLINLATALISWKCFGRILNSSRIGLFASLLYTLAPYRLSNLYLRGSVGEYTALTFLPLILCGFYLIFTEDYKKPDYWKLFLLPALGLTGVVQSHVISCEMVGIFIIIACLIMIERICKIQVFLTLCLAAITTLLLNLNFLVPFLSYFGGDFVMNSESWYHTPIQSAGAYIAQLFPIFQNGIGSSMVTANGMAGEMPLGVGFALFLGLLLFIWLLFTSNFSCKGKRAKSAVISAILAVLSLYMSTNAFPWNALADLSNLTRTMVYNLQFPWRFLTISTLFLVMVTCSALQLAKKHFSKEKYLCIFTALTCFFVVSGSWFYYDILNRGDVYRPYDTTDLNSTLLGSEEYLPTGTNLSLLNLTEPLAGEGVEIQQYEKEGTSIQLRLTNHSETGYVELPLLYYKGYVALSGSDILPLSKGTNNVVRVELPADFDGEITVYFHEPLSWRIGEVISLITLLGIIIGLSLTALNKHKAYKTSEI